MVNWLRNLGKRRSIAEGFVLGLVAFGPVLLVNALAALWLR
jgi:hypothetical protein